MFSLVGDLQLQRKVKEDAMSDFLIISNLAQFVIELRKDSIVVKASGLAVFVPLLAWLAWGHL